MEVINEYENTIKTLESYNAAYDLAYNESYTLNWLINHNCNNYDVINYRQSLILKICHNNDLLDNYKKRIEKHINMSTFFQKIYFFLQFYLKPFTVSEKTYLKYIRIKKHQKKQIKLRLKQWLNQS